MSGVTTSGTASGAAARPRSLARRVGDALTMFLVTGLSLVLLVYVGFGEGKRTYGEFQVDKVAAQAGIARNSMEAFLRHGLLDSRALPENLRSLVPPSVPSGRPVLQFQFNKKKRRTR